MHSYLSHSQKINDFTYALKVYYTSSTHTQPVNLHALKPAKVGHEITLLNLTTSHTITRCHYLTT